jgi:hypothetical protein
MAIWPNGIPAGGRLALTAASAECRYMACGHDRGAHDALGEHTAPSPAR